MLHLDFETRSILDLKKVGTYVYANHPSTEIMALGYGFADQPIRVCKLGMPCPPEVVEHVRSGGRCSAHNAVFELVLWNYCYRRHYPSLPELKISQIDCTMVMAYSMGLPGSLDKASAAMGIDQQKDLKGQRVMLQLSQPKEFENEWDYEFYDIEKYKEKYERMYAYCSQDCEVERELYSRLLPLSASEREMWELDYHINLRGIRVDLSAAVIANSLVSSESERLNEEIRAITLEQVATTSSVKQLKDWLQSRGCAVGSVGKSDVTEMLSLNPEKTYSVGPENISYTGRELLPDDCREALEIRKEAAKSSTKKLEALINRTSKDERMRFTTQYYGAGTGRWAGRGFQVQNLPRPKLKQNEIEGVFEVLK